MFEARPTTKKEQPPTQHRKQGEGQQEQKATTTKQWEPSWVAYVEFERVCGVCVELPPSLFPHLVLPPWSGTLQTTMIYRLMTCSLQGPCDHGFALMGCPRLW